MSKQLTPMQEFKKRLFDVNIIQNPLTLKEMDSFIEKEKKVNSECFEKGFELGNDVTFEHYYNNKFKND